MRMQSRLDAVRSRAGVRGAALAVCAAADVLYGWALLSSLRLAPTFALNLAGHSIWGWVWAWTGLVLATGVFLPSGRDRYHFALAVLIKCTWGALILADWVSRATPGGWGSSVPWLTLALLLVLLAGWQE